MRIATWNLERPRTNGRDKNAARLARIACIDADIWFLTETHAGIVPPGYHALATRPVAGYHSPGENFSTLLSRWPLVRTIETWNPEFAVCAEICTPGGPVLAYATLITYANDRGCNPDSASPRWHEHRQSIAAHRQDWLRLAREFPDLPVLIGGDFNQSRDGSGWYADKRAVAELSDALREASLQCLTEQDFRVSHGLSRASVDHLCVSHALVSRVRDLGVWEGRIDGRPLSDHNGVFVDLDF